MKHITLLLVPSLIASVLFTTGCGNGNSAADDEAVRNASKPPVKSGTTAPAKPAITPPHPPRN